MASRRLLIRSTSARTLASWRCASAWAEAPTDSAWVRAEETICSASRRARASVASDSVCACSRWVVAWAIASRARCSAAVARCSASCTSRFVSAVALEWCSVASRASRSFSTARVRRASWTSRSAAARACSASRLAETRRSLASCCAAEPDLVGLALGAGLQVGGLGAGQAALLLGVGHDPGPGLVELLELDQAHVLGLATGVGSGRLGVALGLLADLGGVAQRGGSDLARLLLGQPQHRRGAAAEAGVRRVLVLLELLAGCLECGLELSDPCAGQGEAAVEAAAARRRAGAGGRRPRPCRSRHGARSAAWYCRRAGRVGREDPLLGRLGCWGCGAVAGLRRGLAGLAGVDLGRLGHRARRRRSRGLAASAARRPARRRSPAGAGRWLVGCWAVLGRRRVAAWSAGRPAGPGRRSAASPADAGAAGPTAGADCWARRASGLGASPASPGCAPRRDR